MPCRSGKTLISNIPIVSEPTSLGRHLAISRGKRNLVTSADPILKEKAAPNLPDLWVPAPGSELDYVVPSRSTFQMELDLTNPRSKDLDTQ